MVQITVRYALQYIQNCPLPKDVVFHVLNVLPPEFTPDMLGQYWRMDMEFSPPLFTEQMQEQIEQQKIAEEEAGKIILQEAIGDTEKPSTSTHKRL